MEVSIVIGGGKSYQEMDDLGLPPFVETFISPHIPETSGNNLFNSYKVKKMIVFFRGM